MPDILQGGQGATLLTAIIIVAIALMALVGVFWIIRNRSASTFIRGGKNRQPRLAVLDATAVDTRRRLVLIRRDDVEHLVMIGGPTDIVIESRIARPDQVAASQQQRASQPATVAARPAAPQPHRSTAPVQPAAAPTEPTFRQPEPALQPPSRPQPPVSAPSPAATIATAGAAAGAIRAEAADLLDSARTRVFEEPGFDESELDELMAVPPAAPSRQAQPQSPAPSASPAAATAATDPMQAEAADVLENARTRVFEEPSFDENAFDELTAAPAEQTGSAAEAPRPAATANRPADGAPSEFETVLAAELSEDLTASAPADSFIAARYTEHQLDPDEAGMLEAPEVQPETQPSRDSLEAEMERLLGDLSRKP
ncbi:flagellar biosynthetic protein FliO [Hoeflea sp. AS16]|uniref:flagellar biosynthetic protein FliO n=1 Tax=Hoeflea sp. AS16 TaxID=3135779 RepID=UPI00316D9A6C